MENPDILTNLSNLDTIKAELDTVKADHSAALALLEEAKGAQAKFDGALADKEAVIVAKVSELATVTASLESVKAELETLKASQKTAEEKAVEIVASQGVPPMKAGKGGNDAPKTREEVQAEFSAIKDPAQRSAFYHANKSAFYAK